MFLSLVSRRVWPLALAGFVACAGTGCTTVLSTASLRDLVLGIDDRVDESTVPSASDSDTSTDTAASDAADAERRAAAIEEAINRLAKISDLDEAARTTLVATLQRTDQEDWPAVVDAFAESLASSSSAHVVAKANLDTGSVTTDDAVAPKAIEAAQVEPSAEPERTVEPKVASQASQKPAPLPPAPAAPPEPHTQPVATVAPPVAAAVAETVSAPEPEVAPDPVSAPAPSPPLTIRNASFATRVQAWGVLDRFAADRFRPGQEVIVYFELENLTAGESAAGHTTCIDSRIRLVTAEGDDVHEWTFEPLAETCRARRHDYFARYVVRIPADAKPGRHRIELGVTDTLSGQVAAETVEFDVISAATAAR